MSDSYLHTLTPWKPVLIMGISHLVLMMSIHGPIQTDEAQLPWWQESEAVSLESMRVWIPLEVQTATGRVHGQLEVLSSTAIAQSKPPVSPDQNNTSQQVYLFHSCPLPICFSTVVADGVSLNLSSKAREPGTAQVESKCSLFVLFGPSMGWMMPNSLAY